MKSLIEAAKIKIDSYWPNLYAKALNGKNIGELLLGGGASSGGDAPAGNDGSADAGAKTEAKAEAKKE